MRKLPLWEDLLREAQQQPQQRNNGGAAIVLDVLSYGTDYDNYPKETSTLVQRSQEAATVLTNVFASSYSEDDDALSFMTLIESWIVDSLWLVNSLIPPPPLSSSNNDDDHNNTDNDNDTASYQALVHIVTALACSAVAFDDQQQQQQEGGGTAMMDHNILPQRGTQFLTRLQGTLDPLLLETSHILPKGGKDSLVKRLRKLNTDLFYRQQKFNIPHEESEGYAKLVTLLTHHLGDDHDGDWKEKEVGSSPTAISTTADNHHNQNSSSSSSSSTTLSSSRLISKRIRECMAAFELDPNRVLDLMLDILELEYSKSLPMSTQETTTTTTTTTTMVLLQVMKEFSCQKIPHLLGFKFASSSNDPQKKQQQQQQQDNLYNMIVLLAQQPNMLDLEALRPHMAVTITNITAATKLWTTLERTRIRSMGRIRLASSSSSATKDSQEQEQLAKLHQYRTEISSSPFVGLLQAFLKQGDWNHACQLVPTPLIWSQLCTLLPSIIGERICTHVHDTLVEPLYHTLVDPPCLRGDNKNSKTTVVTPNSSTTMATTTTLEDVIQLLAEPLYSIVDSGCIQSHPSFYCKVCRLLGALMKQKKQDVTTQQLPKNDANRNNHDDDDDDEIEIGDDTYNFLKTFLVPSLSVFGPNPALSSELWSVLKLLPYATRYRLYSDWRGSGLEQDALRPSSTKSLVQARCEMEAGKAARYALKRLSKDNVRDMGRQVSKVTHSNPLVVLSTILNQIESYGNLIEMMVEAVRFVTPLSLDVLGFCILQRLSVGSNDSSNRSRLKGDGVNVSQWLASIEAFTGAFYKKCPDVEFRGILCFLIHRLSEGHVVELGVLRTLLKTAGGYGFADYTSSASLSKEQLVGRTGSQLLKRETFAFGVVEKLNQKSSKLIRSILQSDGMGVTMLILLAQVRSRILFYQESMTARPKPIKLLGNLFDTCQCVLGLLLEFLTVSQERERGNEIALSKFGEFMPSLVALQREYGLDWEVAWMLCRPVIRAAGMEEENLKEQLDLLKSYLSDPNCEQMLSKTSCARVAPKLFQLFYSNATYDIQCPIESYEAEINRLKEKVDRLTHLQKGGANAAGAKAVLAATAAAAGATQIEINRATQFSRADEEELLRATNNTSNLSSDLSKHKKHYKSTCEQIKATKDTVFDSKTEESPPSMARVFLSDCVFPRCSLTPDDAMYCAQFASLMHNMETPGFSTLSYMDGLISAVSGALFCVTEGEAANISVLLCETWQTLSRWRYDEKSYEKEVAQKPGCFMEKDASEEENGDKGAAVAVSYSGYKSLYSKWHATIGEAALGCLKSSEYIQTRASLIVLTRMVNTFPTQPAIGEKLIDALAPLQEDSYPLKDITAMAQSYKTLVTKARNEGVWKEEDASAKTKREDMEKAAQEERKNAAKKRFEEMKAESEEITAQVGDFVGRDRGRTGGRDERGRTSGRSTPAPAGHKFEPAAGKSMPNANRTATADANRDSSRRGGDEARRGGGGGGAGGGREREKERPQVPGDWRADGGSGGGGGGGSHADGGRRRGGRGLEGRWERDGGSKRERSPPRDMGGRENDRDEHPSKRQRMDRDGGGGGGGGERGGGRGRPGSPSPRSRPSSPSHRSFKQSDRGSSQRQHSDRNVGGGGGGARSTRRPARR